MLRTSLFSAVIIALGASTAAACGYKSQETAQTPLPATAQTPVQSPVPAEPQKDVAELDIKPAAKTN
jgi:hypothetical protein